MSGDLDEFQKVEPMVLPIRFEDDCGNSFFGGLGMDVKEFENARSRSDCPKDKQSFEYYEFLRDKAEAVPCSPDVENAPLTKRDKNGSVLAAYMYGVNAEGVFALRIASLKEMEIAGRHSRTYFMSAFLWRMHMAAAMKLLPAPR